MHSKSEFFAVDIYVNTGDGSLCFVRGFAAWAFLVPRACIPFWAVPMTAPSPYRISHAGAVVKSSLVRISLCGLPALRRAAARTRKKLPVRADRELFDLV